MLKAILTGLSRVRRRFRSKSNTKQVSLKKRRKRKKRR